MGGLPTSTVNGFAVDPSNPEMMYAALRDGVFRSDNGGSTWTPVTAGPKNVAAIAVKPKKPGEVYAATTDGGIVHSVDGGAQWTRVR